MRRGPRRLEVPAGDEKYWRIEPEWNGETAAVFGGGPSLTLAQCDAVRAAGIRAVAINNAYQIAPWADILYFCDQEWWVWHRGEKAYREFRGRKVTLEHPRVALDEPGVLRLKNFEDKPGLCELPWGVYTGCNSGYQAVNMLAHLGVAKIVLLGFDMRVAGRRTHWHMAHQRPTTNDVFERYMIPAFKTLAGPLKDWGIEIVNCTPGSALTCFPMMPIEQALAS